MGIEKEKKTGVVYVLSNPLFDSYVKIGHSTELKRRIEELSRSVPFPFRCEFAIEVDNYKEIEGLAHKAFANDRGEGEFFEIEAQRVIYALKMTGGKDVTPKEDIAGDAKDGEGPKKTVVRQKTYSFEDAHVQVDDVLVYSLDQDVTATVVANKKIKFEGQTTSLSMAALTLLRRDGCTWPQVNGWRYWMKDDETLKERAQRFAQVEDEDED